MTKQSNISDTPLGFSNQSEPFSLDSPISQRLKPLAEMSFLDLVGKAIYLQYRRESSDPEFPDIIAYGYIDHTAGLSFHALCAARLVGDSLETRDTYKERLLTIRAGALDEVLCAQVADSTLSNYSERIELVENIYNRDEGVKETRKIRFLDPLRHPLYPDDIQAILVTNNDIDGYEGVWVKLRYITNDTVYGELLNDPYQKEYNVNAGAILPLAFRKSEDDIIAYAMADKAQENHGA